MATNLDFFVVLVEEGKLTPKLWALDVGDALEVSEKATGSFYAGKNAGCKALVAHRNRDGFGTLHCDVANIRALVAVRKKLL